MTSAEDPALELARRLRSLRKSCWPGKRITQEQLAKAFDVSVPLISSWERTKDPVLPPQHRLDAYAIFFATARSVDQKQFRLIDPLTEDEEARRDSLIAELTGLRNQVTEAAPAASPPSVTDNLWKFPTDENITIVCSELPEYLLAPLPFTDPEDPDYVELYRYSDLDSLLELHGHIRALNPDNNVYIRAGSLSLTPDDYSSHLVLLGGVDWNQVTAEVLHRIDLPIKQQNRPDDTNLSGFEVTENGVRRTFRPVLRDMGGQRVLEEDVAHFYRSPNPFNRNRTVTICNGMFSRGTLGAVRALTDARFRVRNNAHVHRRFAGHDTFSIISRVQVLAGSVVTPDWTSPDFLLHEWPETTT
ncbi:Transcriptional regulator, contains XRE-family HTH domain [Lentzea waywayandensis]|uniref:Transcriptional regulator, contains XRE-family HTH domain n=1 Tax=Lentzea waywayandensis TaxID=84724 RepID=A0A1I6F4E5_9PSEU|nr:helix-turn-helix domain-containing protein [Lentzea waywayandensis]SFR24823.1 Transcriptional regulator, contains XRE-family HTH domain [Lentzea waywayandensis]